MNDWQAWIGRQTTRSEIIDPAQANRMAATLDRDPTFTAGDALPPAWHWLYFHDVVPASRLGGDGHPELGVTMPPVPLPRRMWAAGRLDFHHPIRLADAVQRISTIRSITPKTGRTGELYFVTVQHELSTADQVNLREQQTIVYRELTAPESAAGTPAPDNPDITTEWTVDTTTLFRYSALTFNGHRIHYDVDYAREVEGYPNLVIHGPLVATLLADLASRHARPMRRFAYRSRRALYLPDAFTVNGAADGESTDLWAATASGELAMQATAYADIPD